ncbi:gamma-glutamyltransferase [Sphingomicrobium sediminis]|uniref:Glutathione hydrolase proenzyme n=1 Tax=Sphingomicrobium sediminis TaxID=2950949 RepID=A0A9X2EM01_9SPHN|nr:gamma-glutamyltransferase [Sphingomicrobium sediminis]MCM8557914.1 gamma-glutamyltransferase [Sphingomicrobium sediminis]
MLRTMTPLAALLLASCSTLPETYEEPQVAVGAVSAAEPRAVAAGEEILAKGGSATDAAIAVLVTLTLVEPQSSGIGGGGFMLRADNQGNITTYDGRERAPMAAGPDWFLGPDGEPVPFRSVVPGGRSVGVPGNVALMKMAHDAHGKLEWSELFAPAIALARGGFPMTNRLHTMLGNEDFSRTLTAEQRAIYFDAEGNAKPVGTMLTNPVFADFLERLAADGPSAFYTGANARAIADKVSLTEVAPAPMTTADLAAYEAMERAPVCAEYRTYYVCSMGPPSSGATTVLQILGLLERFDLAALGPDSPAFWHLFAEASKVAWADRNAYLGDADFVSVPVAGMLDKTYLAGRSAMIDPESALTDVAPGSPAGAVQVAFGMEPNENGTSHFAVADGEGNVVSLTSTIEGAFGSGLMVNGYFLNNELTDFSFRPVDEAGNPVANAVAAGKRPRSSMSPTIVFDEEGTPVLAIGAAGGPTIITQTAKNIIAYIDFGYGAQQAIYLPNMYAPGVVMIEEHDGAEALAAALRDRGHADVRIIAPRFKANAVERVNSGWVAAFDPRTQKDVLGVAAP